MWEYAPAPESRDIANLKPNYRMFVDGKFVEGTGEPLKTINPATEEVLAEVSTASQSDVDTAVKAARIQPGDRVLVEAASGGVGSLLVQLARRAGAVVLEASSKGGVGYDWTDLEPVDVVFESIGGEVGKRAFELLKDGVGRMVVFGYASGEPLDVTASDIFRKGVAVMGLPRDVTPEEVFAHRLKPVLGDVYRLDEIAEAHRALEARTTKGKLIARP